MEEDRWPRKCMREEVRSIKNGNPTKWGKEMQKALNKTGDNMIIEWIWEDKSRIMIEERLVQLNKVAIEQDIQKDWIKIDKSSYCSHYKEIKKNLEIEHYWRIKTGLQSKKNHGLDGGVGM